MACSMGPTLLLVLLIMYSMDATHQANCNDYFLICPHDQIVGLGENAMFFCEVEQDEEAEIGWIIVINGTEYSMDKSNLAELEELNFTLGTTNGYSLSLEVVATVANNNTQISCRQHLPNPPHIAFIEATLTVVGAPLPPAPRLTVVDATHLNLSWDPPFHLDQEKYPILYYKFQVTNASDGEVLEDRKVNGTYEIYNISATAEPCHTLSFKVTATTAVGTSSPGEVQGGFPIPTTPFDNSSLVVKQTDGSTPSVNISFMLPMVCSYQVVSYEVVIWEDGSQYGGNDSFVLLRNGTCSENCSQKEIKLDSVGDSDLKANKSYLIIVEVLTDAGKVSSQHYTFRAPLPPVPKLTAIDATHLNLSWDPPFLLDQEKYPITYYEVQVTNTTDGEVSEDRLVNGTYEIYSISATAETCHTLSFKVTATTAVGTSSPGEVKGGFPIPPTPLDNSSLVVEQSDGQILVKLQLPVVCSYQVVRYEVVICENGSQSEGNDSSVLRTNGNCNENCSQKEIKLEIKLDSVGDSDLNGNYLIKLEVFTDAENVSFEVYHFVNSTTAPIPPSAVVPRSKEDSSGGVDNGVIAGAAGGVAVILVLAVAVFALSIHCHIRRIRASKLRSRYNGTFPPPLVNNPIYEGPSEYENLDGYQNGFEGSYATPGPPALPPPRKADPAKAASDPDLSKLGPEHASSNDECYTVMDPAGTIQPNGHMQPRVTEGNKYVITEC